MATEKPRQKRGRPTEPAGQGAFKTAASTQVLVPGRSPSLPPPGSSALCFSWCFVCSLRLRSFPGTPPRVVTSGPGPCMFACRPPSSLSLSLSLSLVVACLLVAAPGGETATNKQATQLKQNKQTQLKQHKQPHTTNQQHNTATNKNKQTQRSQNKQPHEAVPRLNLQVRQGPFSRHSLKKSTLSPGPSEEHPL